MDSIITMCFDPIFYSFRNLRELGESLNTSTTTGTMTSGDRITNAGKSFVERPLEVY